MHAPQLRSDPAKRLSSKKILFVIHTHITFFLDVLTAYTTSRCRSFTAIGHPLYPVRGTRSILRIYRGKNPVRQAVFPRLPGPSSANFLKDFFLTVYWAISTHTVYDIAIGADNLNTLSLLILRFLGRVRRVIYLSVDYTPRRFANPLLNTLYHLFDTACCYHADIIWNSSGRMNEARIKNGMEPGRIAYSLVTPDGCNFDSRKLLPVGRIVRKRLIFLGHMRPVMGVDLMLESFAEVIRSVPDAEFILIGEGPNLADYRALAAQLGLGSHVRFTGFIENHDEVDDLLCTGAVGLAPFKPDKNSYEFYSDVGKPKAYLAAGLPVIITRVPEIAGIIEKAGAGIAIAYNKKELVSAMVRLLTDDALYRRCRTNAIRLSEHYRWEHIFSEAFGRTLDYFEQGRPI
ncbi:glycosyltransferase [Patescibacteria group bacterium]|nr:glycosyltransferase [Patescibacteria group bacterium]